MKYRFREFFFPSFIVFLSLAMPRSIHTYMHACMRAPLLRRDFSLIGRRFHRLTVVAVVVARCVHLVANLFPQLRCVGL